MTETGADSARQVALYGEPWSQRLTRLLQGYRLSQARLGSVIGLSAPMISQLMSGHRVKISNPAVFGRIVRLEDQLTHPAVAAGDSTVIEAVLADVAASNPTLTTLNAPLGLAGLATPEQYRHLAAVARSIGAPQLADALESASDSPR